MSFLSCKVSLSSIFNAGLSRPVVYLFYVCDRKEAQLTMWHQRKHSTFSLIGYTGFEVQIGGRNFSVQLFKAYFPVTSDITSHQGACKRNFFWKKQLVLKFFSIFNRFVMAWIILGQSGLASGLRLWLCFWDLHLVWLQCFAICIPRCVLMLE